MAKNSIRDFDNTAGNNTDIQSVDISEGCSPAGINNAIREVMADLADVNDGTVALESPQADSLTVTGDLTVDTDTLYVDSTNDIVGIGTTSPSTNTSTYYDDLVIKNDTSGSGAGISILSNTTNGFSGVEFRKADGTQVGKIYGNSSAGSVTIETGGSSRMAINSAGRIGVGETSPTSIVHAKAADPRLRIQDSTTSYSSIDAGIGLSGTESGVYRTDVQWVMRNNAATLCFDYGTSALEKMRLDNSGRLYLNTTSTSNYSQTSGDSSWMFRTEEGSVIHAQDADDGFSMMYMNKFDWTSSKDSRYINWYKNGSSVASIALTSGGLVSYGTGSDYRLKENVTDMTGGITRIKQINPKQFNLIDDPDDITMDGFLAHELATVIPEAVVGTHNQVKSRTNVVRNADGNFIEDGVTQDEWTQGKTDGDYPNDSTWVASWDEPIYQTVDYGKVTPLLVAALQEAITKIETLETKVAALEAN
jgi:hypothetical protein